MTARTREIGLNAGRGVDASCRAISLSPNSRRSWPPVRASRECHLRRSRQSQFGAGQDFPCGGYQHGRQGQGDPSRRPRAFAGTLPPADASRWARPRHYQEQAVGDAPLG
ncbi:MAG: hypothetical protein MZV63_36200 [Marinilabiliales bacterium]|nr:hypothetical protein [Marinilabiliales bacterium]